MAKSVNLSVGRGEKLPVSKGAGLTAKGRAKYNRETGSNLKAPAPNPKTEKDRILEELYVRAEESKKVPLLSQLNGNAQLHKELIERAMILPMQYYTLYGYVIHFECEGETAVKRYFYVSG